MSGKREDAWRRGEAAAASYLERQGFRIVSRNYRCRLGEIDLVVHGPEGLVFVEVRTKRRPCLFSPEESVTRMKVAQVVKLAQHYLLTTGAEEQPWRVDVVAVELGPAGDVLRLEHYRDATSDVMAD